MQAQDVTFGDIIRLLQRVPVSKLTEVYSMIAENVPSGADSMQGDSDGIRESGPLECALLSEQALAVNWDTPEEDLAWANLRDRIIENSIRLDGATSS